MMVAYLEKILKITALDQNQQTIYIQTHRPRDLGNKGLLEDGQNCALTNFLWLLSCFNKNNAGDKGHMICKTQNMLYLPFTKQNQKTPKPLP